MNLSDPTPSNQFDVARERWITLRHFVIIAGLAACVHMMTKCSEKWMDKEYHAEEKRVSK